MGKRTRRKAPTVTNAAYAAIFTWDGRADTLENVIAIGWSQLGMTDQEVIAKKLDDNPRLSAVVRRGVRRRRPAGCAFARRSRAYLRILRSGDSPYDRFVAGDERNERGREARTRDVSRRSDARVPQRHRCSRTTSSTTSASAATSPSEGRGPLRESPRSRATAVGSERRRCAMSRAAGRGSTTARRPRSSRRSQSWPRGGVPNPNLDAALVKRTPTAAELADLEAFLEALSGVSDAAAPEGAPRRTTAKVTRRAIATITIAAEDPSRARRFSRERHGRAVDRVVDRGDAAPFGGLRHFRRRRARLPAPAPS